jgi:F-type H+-transporting ATPase subunit a
LELHHAELVNLTEWGILSINKAVIWMFIAAFAAFLTIYLGGRKALVPGRHQGAIETILALIREKMVLDTMGHEGLPYFPFIASLFFFVFFCNIVGIFPLHDYGYTATSNINVTATLTVLVFGVVLVTGIRKKGIGGYMKSFAPHGVPWPLLPVIYPVEIISLFAKHFALAVRLFANMYAGHTVILVFATGAGLLWLKGLTASTAFGHLWLGLAPLPFVGVVVMLVFEIFVALIQAFIFAILAALYIGDSLREHH